MKLPILLLTLGLCGGLAAQDAVVIYKCTDAAGNLTVQNGTPCPKGTKQDKRVIETASSSAPYIPAAPTIAPVPAAPPPAPQAQPVMAATAAPATPVADRLPPPPLYQCNTYDNDSYLSDTAEVEPRCVPVATTGIDGSASNGAGQACQMVTDQCQRVPDGAACDSWKRRTREAEAAWKFARTDTADGKKIEYERIARVLSESTCGQ